MNTAVFTHLPPNVCLFTVVFAPNFPTIIKSAAVAQPAVTAAPAPSSYFMRLAPHPRYSMVGRRGLHRCAAGSSQSAHYRDFRVSAGDAQAVAKQ